MLRDDPGKPLVLVLDGDATRREHLAQRFETRGYTVSTAGSVKDALACTTKVPRALVLEQRLRDGTALDFLAQARGLVPRPFVLVHGDWPVGSLPHRPHGIDAFIAQSEPDFSREVLRQVEVAVPLKPCCGLPSVHRGDHLLLVYESRHALLDSLGAYFSCGLAEGERCLLACEDSASADEARAHFERAGIDVERLERNGAFSLLEHEESYFVGGKFDPKVMLDFVRDLVSSALEDGYSALRAAGEASWLRETPEDREAWMHYETELSPVCAEGTLTGLCCYRLGAFDPATLLETLRTHALVLDGRTVCRNDAFGGRPLDTPAHPELELRARLASIRTSPRAVA